MVKKEKLRSKKLEEERRAECSDAAAAATSVLVLLFLNHLCLAALTHVLIYIFVNIYLHICIIVHICYGIYLHFCICANIWKGCRVAERLEDAALHMSKATDVKLCEMIAHEDKCQFWVPLAYFGTFSQNIF